MVASGLPVRNEDGHAVEMAELSLEIRSTICDMSVPHLPDHALQIRIGLNSGEVVVVVVVWDGKSSVVLFMHTSSLALNHPFCEAEHFKAVYLMLNANSVRSVKRTSATDSNTTYCTIQVLRSFIYIYFYFFYFFFLRRSIDF